MLNSYILISISTTSTESNTIISAQGLIQLQLHSLAIILQTLLYAVDDLHCGLWDSGPGTKNTANTTRVQKLVVLHKMQIWSYSFKMKQD